MTGPPRFRWTVCALLFLATTINYVDRQILGILAGALQSDLGWTESEYGLIVTAFQVAYAAGLLGFGRLIDVAGTRAGYSLAIGLWSVAAAAHGLVRSAFAFGAARFFLGLGEAGNFPAAVKAVGEWFPPKERAFAVGVFNSGSTVGAIATPLIVPWLALKYGWQAAFILTGLAGLLWVPLWLALYRRGGPYAGASEPGAQAPWLSLLGYRQTWALLIARFLTDPVWWFYLFWGPKFLQTRFGLTLDQVGLPLVCIYLISNAGGLFGGWLSSALLKRGLSLSAARKLAILACALLVVPAAFSTRMSGAWGAVLVIGLAAAGHQGWASNLFAMIADIYPARAVASATGLSGFGGSLGGMAAAAGAGFLLERTGSYTIPFAYAGVSYLLILAVIHGMIPRICPLSDAAGRPQAVHS
jgi:ACS family hexuronate transporter-like MFS transporter